MSQISQVKDAVDIVNVISQRLDLKQAGSSYRALCPFHSEKSPSFFVNPQLQRYRCFGCGAKGDVFEFLQQYEGMSFYESLQHLADEAGIELKQYAKTKEDDLREQVLEILQLATKYYHYLLTEHKSGIDAKEYLKKRGINNSSINLFQIGYALDAWDGLFSYLAIKKKYDPLVIEQSGLIVRNRSGRYYDRFRNRIVFPLKNHRGQIVGLSGRLISSDEEDKNQPKYLNTPETILYHKAKTLYGYSELFQDIRNKKEVIVCEGEFDVISSQQNHVKHIVAIKGSALTTEQAKLLERSVEKVIITLDSDEAGIKATRRAIDIIRNTNLDLRVIDLSQIGSEVEIHDVDDLIQKNPALWRKVSKESISAYEFLIGVALRKYDLNSASGRRKIIDELAPVIKNISHEVEKDFYLKQLANKLNVTVGILNKDIDNFGLTKHTTNKNSQDQTTTSSQSPTELIQEYLLFLLFNADDKKVVEKAKELEKLEFSYAQANMILEKLVNFDQEYSLDRFAMSLPEDLKAFLMEWCHLPQYSSEFLIANWDKEWKKTISKYQQYDISNKIELLNKEISKIEREKKSGADSLIQKKMSEIAQLQAKLKLVTKIF